MNISYDNTADALYFKLKDGTFGSNKEVVEGVVLDLSEQGELLGIEILDASSRFNLAKNFGEITVQMPMAKMGQAAVPA